MKLLLMRQSSAVRFWLMLWGHRLMQTSKSKFQTSEKLQISSSKLRTVANFESPDVISYTGAGVMTVASSRRLLQLGDASVRRRRRAISEKLTIFKRLSFERRRNNFANSLSSTCYFVLPIRITTS